jgi:hypothetical protein
MVSISETLARTVDYHREVRRKIVQGGLSWAPVTARIGQLM